MNKKLFLFNFLLCIVLISNSCKKDDNSPDFTNSITITGTFTVGGKEYINPTFALGSASEHIGYYIYNSKSATGIKLEPWDIVELGNNTVLNYNFDIYGTTPSSNPKELSGFLSIYQRGDDSDEFTLMNQNVSAVITKVEEVGGYIEGTYEGDFQDFSGNTTYHIIGVFKVKHYKDI